MAKEEELDIAQTAQGGQRSEILTDFELELRSVNEGLLVSAEVPVGLCKRCPESQTDHWERCNPSQFSAINYERE